MLRTCYIIDPSVSFFTVTTNSHAMSLSVLRSWSCQVHGTVHTCTITLLANSDATNWRRCLILSRATSAALFSCCGVNGGMTTGGGGGVLRTPRFGRSSPAGTTETQCLTLTERLYYLWLLVISRNELRG